MPGTSINNICTTIRIKGQLSIPLLQKSMELLVEGDPALRTRILLQEERPCQYFAAYSPHHFPYFDFSATNRESFFSWEESIARDIMPLIDSPLYWMAAFRLSEEEGGVLLKTHHLISDGWSQAQLCNRLAELYLMQLAGETGAPMQQRGACGSTGAELEYRQSKAHERDLAFWDAILEKPFHPAVLKKKQGAETSPVGRRKSFAFSGLLSNQIYSFCQKHRVSPFSVAYMALAAYLLRTSGESRFCIGVPVMGRTEYEEKQATGMYVSTLPLVGEVEADWSFTEFTGRSTEHWLDVLKHQRLPFGEITGLARKHHPGMEKPFQIVLSYQNSKITVNRESTVAFSGRWHYSGCQAEQLCIHLSNLEDEKQYVISYDYLTQLFSGEEIDTLHTCLVNLLADGLSNPDKPIGKLSMLNNREKENVLFRFNDTAVGPYGKSLYLQWEKVLRESGSRTALIQGGNRMRYGELGAYACTFARKQIELDPNGKSTVALLLGKGLSLVAAILGTAQAGNTWVILPPDFPSGRLAEMLENSGAQMLVGDTQLLEKHSLRCKYVINADHIGPAPTGLHAFRLAEPEDTAYVIYTSGSTGAPKGVEVTHRGLMNYTAAMKGYYGHGAVLSLCHTGFDVFVLESIVSLLNGKTVVLPTEKEQETPALLAKLVKNYGVGFFAMTPSRLRAYLGDADFATSLSGVERIVCGGEAVSGELVRRVKTYTNARVYNQYGPAETSIGVSIKRIDGAPAITAGRPMQNCRIYVLDQNRMPLPAGVEGELYIGGVCVGKGYRNAPDLTEQTFLKDPFIYGEQIYKTGDMGRFTPDGEIVIIGRKDAQAKLRGQRMEPQEIAARLMAHPGIGEAAARVVERGGVQIAVAYYTAANSLPQSELLEYMAVYLPSYMIPAYTMHVAAIPLTANGKVDFERLPPPEEGTGGAAPQGDTQRKILEILRRTLCREAVYADSDYFQCGGDSLGAVSVIAELEQAFGVELRVADLYACRTAQKLEELICSHGRAPRRAMEKAPAARASFPLTPIQQSIYVQSKLDQTGMAYNMPGAFVLPEHIDLTRLKGAFKELVRTEPMLRASFALDGAQVVQRIGAETDFMVSSLDAPDFAAACAAFVQPFDLACAPLLRAALWKHDGQTILFLDAHHIISDGLGSRILMQRLDALYRGETPPGAYSYLDYSLWRQQKTEAARGYWEQAVSGVKPLDLPTDFKRSQAFDYVGGNHLFKLPEVLARRCAAYCKEHETSAYVLFAAVFGILLQKLSGADDFLVGTPVSGRREKEHETIFGTFISTLPLRLSPGKGRSARTYLDEVKQRVVELLDHQYSGPEELAALSGTKRSLSQNALYQVMFSMRPVDADFMLDGESMTYLPIETRTAKFDLNLEAARQGETYSFVLEYASSLFERETAEYFGRCFTSLLERLVENDTAELRNIDPLCPGDRQALVENPNRICIPYLCIPIDMQVDDMVARHPDKAAVIFHGEETTYREIRARADALAGFLQERGVTRGDHVAFCLRRGPDILAAMLGILKAGAAYVPMIDSLPKDRMRYMLENAQAKLLLCDGDTRAKLPADICPLEALVMEHAPYTPVPGRGGEDIMQILYTSGTTGQPKGVMLKTKSFCNLLPVMRGLLDEVDGNFLCITNAIFDTFITETLYQMALGKTIVMADEEEMMLPWKIAQLIEEHGGGMIQFTPSRLQMCLANEAFCKAMRHIGFTLVCGEVFPLPLLRKLEGTGNTRIVTMYGPTEVTVYMTQESVRGWHRMVVGKPMPNCRVYALDKDGEPVMPLARGELYIAGECLSAGYIGRPDLMEAAFLPDPFYGGLMYKTGDIGRLRLDGNYEFYGREDSQVKLNGQRIELGEITGQMLLHPSVGEAAAVVARKEDGSSYLRGLVVFRDGHARDMDALKRHLQENLPSYMVPAKLEALEEMPRTASGKTDVLLLSDGGMAEAQAKEQKQQTREQRGIASEIIQMWREVLETEQVEPDVSFFDQGGTSLGAVTLVGMYYQMGWEVTLEQFYNNPTLAAQEALLSGLGQVAQAEGPGAVLLTGATGFLGMHLIQALYGAGIPKIICLGRGNSAYGYADRIRNNLQYYFGERAEEYAGILEPVEGDIGKPGFGLPQPELDSIAAQTAYVLHAAADTRHYASDKSAMQVNCEGTAHAIALARRANARLLHISTISVCGEHLVDDPYKTAAFPEEAFDIGQNWQDNIYVKSKFLAEKLVFEAMEDGLDARIFRVGRLVGRNSDGRFQKNPKTNLFYSIVRGISALGAYPASMAQTPVELSAVDECARAVVLLKDGEHPVYHVFNPYSLPLHEIVRQYGTGIAELDDAAFDAHLREQMGNGNTAQLAVLLETRNRMAQKPIRIEPVADRTAGELLERSFAWECPDVAVLLREFREGGRVGID